MGKRQKRKPYNDIPYIHYREMPHEGKIVIIIRNLILCIDFLPSMRIHIQWNKIVIDIERYTQTIRNREKETNMDL